MQRFTSSRRRILSLGQGRVGWPGALLCALILLGPLAPLSEAMTIHGENIVIPVVAHAAGLEGSQWRSDVWITNPYGDTVDITLHYYPAGGSELTASFTVEGYRGVHLPDIVLETFGLDSSKGMLLAEATSSIEARARIYNTGNPCGEFGQAVPGLPVERLSSQGYLSGLSTAEGVRLNIGLANPGTETITVQVVLTDLDTGEQVWADPVAIGPHGVIQIDRIGERLGLSGRSNLDVRSSNSGGDVFYAYASVVRNDTGDATFIYGTAPNRGPA